MLADERYPTDLVVTKEDFLQSGWKDAISDRDHWNHTIRSRLKTPFFYMIRLSSRWIMAI